MIDFIKDIDIFFTNCSICYSYLFDTFVLGDCL